MTINVDAKAIVAFVLAAGVISRRTMGFVSRMAVEMQPVVADAEERAKDGLIDRADRKAIAMGIVREMEEHEGLKLNFITRFVVSRVIDDIARLLPDFKLN